MSTRVTASCVGCSRFYGGAWLCLLSICSQRDSTLYTALILFFTVAIIVSFLCSLWESVLLSITPAYTQLQVRKKSRIGQRLQIFKRNIDRPLAAILTLNTIAHTAGAIGVGEQATRLWHDTHPFVTAFLVPVVMTLAILVLSEIIPKTVGANYWKELARFTVASLSLLLVILAPAVWLSERLTRFMRKGREGSVFSRSEFLALAEIGAKQGVIAEKESHFIHNLMRFNRIQVKDVMTPRVVVKSAPEDTSVSEYFSKYMDIHFTRIPIYEGDNPEKVTGYVRKDELLLTMVEQNTNVTLKALKRDILAVLPNSPIPNLFNTLLEKREHIALVVDEFGGMCGIATMEDVIETLLGLEIVDELDNVEDMQKLARNRWQQRAQTLGLVKNEDEKQT